MSSSKERLSDTLSRLLVSSLKERGTALAIAGALPLLASTVWYYSRTVIEVTDEEQKMWVRTWMDMDGACSSSIRRLRRLVLVSASQSAQKKPGNMRLPSKQQNNDEPLERREGGRFAPPRLLFLPPDGISSWAWCGWWPVSITSSPDESSGGRDPWSPRRGDHTKYSISVWFAPHGLLIAQNLLLRGRELYLAKRARVTEIWIGEIVSYGMGSRETFSVVARPSRPLSTVIIEGSTKRVLREDAINFLNGEKWYVEKGIPYRRGYLLYGPPGCGKTSLVTALAGDLRLPIVLVSLGNKDMTDSNLMKFLSQIPRDSIVLLEDIDCAVRMDGNTGKEDANDHSIEESKAGMKKAAEAATGSRMSAMSPAQAEAIAKRMASRRGRRSGADASTGGGLTLSGLLNAIDGVGAQEGRILFMTTNRIDNLDEALIRPGRVDAKFYVGKASKAAAGELFDQFFRANANGSATGEEHARGVEEDMAAAKGDPLEHARSVFLEKVQDRAHSFAELQGVLMQARDDPTTVGTAMEEFLKSTSGSKAN